MIDENEIKNFTIFGGKDYDDDKNILYTAG